MSRSFAIRLTTAAIGLIGTVCLAAEAPTVEISQSIIKPFLQAHCVQCHGPKKSKGQLRFDELSTTIDNNDVAQRWQDVLDVLNAGEMPPEDEPQPPTAELAAALDSLTGSILEARKRLTDHGGEIAMRRLNQREYAASIRHLFGFEPLLDSIPADDGVEPFDTVGSQQFFTSSHLNQYLALGEKVVSTAIKWSTVRAKPKSQRHQSEQKVTPAIREKLAELDRQMALKKAGKSWQEMGFKDEGEMQIIFRQFNDRAGGRRRYLEYPRVNDGLYLCDAVTGTKFHNVNFHHADPRATYRIRIRAGIHGDPLPIRRFLRIDADERTIAVAKVTGTPDEPGIVEITHQPSLQEFHMLFRVRENRDEKMRLVEYLRRIGRKKPMEPGEGAAIWLDWIEVEGPFHPPQRSFFDRLICPEDFPVGDRGKTSWNAANARELIQRFTFEAFRHRQPSEAFIDGLHQHFQSLVTDGKTFNAAIADTLAIVLASPGFLYLHEQAPADDRNKKLTPREVAIRLAYFIWSAPPDEALYRAADAGDLTGSKRLRAQIDRLLASPKSRALAVGFASQWAELDRFDAITVDSKTYPRFNDGLRHAAKNEVISFFHHLVANNLPARNLIDSDFAMLDAQLGVHYGIPGVETASLAPVKLPAESPRGGLIAQTAFLATGSTGERTSPVIRGALVMDKLLHDPPAPPPPNVPELGAGINKPSTNRDLVERHQKQAQCASCHKKMDVIGFGLENFDAIGQWRQTETVGRKQVPISPAGVLPDGSAFDDVHSLKKVLLAQEQNLARGVVESILAYALGRTIEFSDGDDVDAIMAQVKPQQYRLGAIIHAIAENPLFSQH